MAKVQPIGAVCGGCGATNKPPVTTACRLCGAVMAPVSPVRVAFDEYLKIEAVNWSTLKELRRSPLHYRHRLEVERKDNPRMALGRAAHTATFEPDRFMVEYACYKGGIRRGKKWDSFVEAHGEDTILKLEEYQTCLAIRDAVRANPVAAEYLERGKGEQTIQWTHAETKMACKGRVDWVSESKPALVDLKTTGNIDINIFTALSARMGYHCQGAFYRDGLTQVLGAQLPVVLIVVEAKAPHDVAVFKLDEDALYAGQEEVDGLMRTLAACRGANSWSGRYIGEQTLCLPRWMMDEESDTDLGDDLVFGTQSKGEPVDDSHAF